MTTLLLAALLWGCRMDDYDEDGLRADVDCDDLSAEVYPGADEYCDGIDNDCDGRIDEGPVDGDYVYLDEDGDGYGTLDEYGLACDVPRGYAAHSGDCDDDDPDRSPGIAEVCDGIDNDCDLAIDNGLPMASYYTDEDGDGYGGPDVGIEHCGPQPGMAPDSGDCDDDDPAAYPGAALREDQALCTRDLDGDGYGAQQTNRAVDPGTDCDDTDPLIGPQQPERCGDLTDNNCDGLVDEGC